MAVFDAAVVVAWSVDVGVCGCGITTAAIAPTAIIATAVIVNSIRGW